MSTDIYTILSPWPKIDYPEKSIFNDRVTDLNGKTVGMWYYFKEHGRMVAEEIAILLKERFPRVKFSYLQYPVDTKEMKDDPAFIPVLKEWLDTVDTVLCTYGDGGSCAMYVAYNAAYIEALGKPTMVLANIPLANAAHRGYASRGVPDGRIVKMNMQDLSLQPKDQYCYEHIIRPAVRECFEDVVTALTKPTTEAEKPHSFKKQESYTGMKFTGTYEEINNFLYKMGWTNGTPVIPPTAEAVNEMLTGTDLPRDHVVAKLRPSGGYATVEKIAINAVMAGCLPTYLPAVIAAVEAAADPIVNLEGWTCSIKSWNGPFLVLNGPVRFEIGMETQSASLAPYTRAQSSIARAFAYVILNLAGTRPRLEDSTYFGSDGRFGVCFAEDEENSPWEPHQADFGFKKTDSTVNLFWPVARNSCVSTIKPANVQDILEKMCEVEDCSFYTGCTYVMTAKTAQVLADAGFSKQGVLDYIVEYARRKADIPYLEWMINNNHPVKDFTLPKSPAHSLRKFYNKDHLQIIVCGCKYVAGAGAYAGTGDHGGPAMARMQLPKNWDVLVKKYKEIAPDYIDY